VVLDEERSLLGGWRGRDLGVSPWLAMSRSRHWAMNQWPSCQRLTVKVVFIAEFEALEDCE